MYPLYFSKKNKKMLIKEIKGSKDSIEKCVSRGFIPGAEISILREEGENMIVFLNSSYFILNKELALFIYVEEKNIQDSKGEK